MCVSFAFFAIRISQLNYYSTFSMNQLIEYFLRHRKVVTHLLTTEPNEKKTTDPHIQSHTHTHTYEFKTELKPFSVAASHQAGLILSASCWLSLFLSGNLILKTLALLCKYKSPTSTDEQ